MTESDSNEGLADAGASASAPASASSPVAPDVRRTIEDLYRHDRRPLLAGLIRRCGGDFELAEDVLQEAFAQAWADWPESGLPPAPAAWIATTARRRAIDRIRRSGTRKNKAAQVVQLERARAARMPDDEAARVIRDDELRLLFTCCHPALSMSARVALTLKTVAGLSTGELARAFLVEEPTLAQRIVRAKRKIRDAGIPYRTPAPDDLPERLSGVLRVLYLIFNEGYASTSDERLVRGELCREAIRLAELVVRLMPTEPEAQGLLALMLLHDARAEGRTRPDGVLIPLEEQDRSRWSQAQIATGRAVLTRALRHGRTGPYLIQAQIAAEHVRARAASDTDWGRIVALYEALMELHPGPVVRLNHAAAVAMDRGPEAGLMLMDATDLAKDLDRYHLFHAARADLLRRADRRGPASAAYEKALARVTNPAERAYLEERLASLAE